MSPQPDVRICLDCGFSEFLVPEKWLSAGWLQAGRPKPAPVSVPTPINEVRRQIA
jgi:hypothetical protein